jgi:microcystin-dependent protein
MNRSSFFPLGALCAALLLSANLAQAQSNAKPPTQMTYQGFLTDGNGLPFGSTTPVNKTVIFRIYDALTGGTLRWSSQQVVTVDKGYFSVLLGQGSGVGSEPFNADLTGVFTGPGASDRYLELTADGTTIAPRLRFLPAPSAMLAKSATELLDPVTGASSLSVSGGNISTGGTLTAGNATVTGTVTTGNVTANGNISLQGNMNANGTVTGASFNGYGTIPLGGIIMWSGSVSAVPAGWALCDGRTANSRQTPDLRGRFIVGAGSGAVGLTSRDVNATGGSEQITLTVGQLPAHNHQVQGTTASAGAHTHTVDKAPTDDRNFTDAGGNQTLGVVADAAGTGTRSMSTSSAGDHTHSFNVTSANTGSGSPVGILPPFYALAFIMRVQ